MDVYAVGGAGNVCEKAGTPAPIKNTAQKMAILLVVLVLALIVNLLIVLFLAILYLVSYSLSATAFMTSHKLRAQEAAGLAETTYIQYT